AASPASVNPVEIHLGHAGSFLLRGRIDRVDELGPGEFVVWDYKTGGTYGFKENRHLNAGRQIQHALYAMAAERLLSSAEYKARVRRSGYFFPGPRGEGQRISKKQDVPAARTGKTTSLVRRMVALVRRRKTTIERMTAITYTRKAAAHLREKFQIELEGAARTAEVPSERETFQSALGGLHQCFIGTVHSLCARLLRERPVEAGVDPDFQELDDLEDGMMRSRFWAEYCQRLFINNDPALGRLSKVGINPRD